MSTKKNPPPKQPERRLTKRLPCKLTPRELQDRKNEMVDVELSIKAKKTERDGICAPINQELAELKKEHTELLAKVEKGTEDRDVSCVEERDYQKGEVWYRRIDTRGEVPDSRREMTAAERQEVFPSVGAPSKKQRGKVNDLDEEAPAAEA